jgi:hypothetical protein
VLKYSSLVVAWSSRESASCRWFWRRNRRRNRRRGTIATATTPQSGKAPTACGSSPARHCRLSAEAGTLACTSQKVVTCNARHQLLGSAPLKCTRGLSRGYHP